MKTTITLLTSLLFSLYTSAQSSGWKWITPKPQGNDLTAIATVDSLTAICIGRRGTILKTTDGGETWALKPCPTNLDLLSVSFFDENRGVIGADSGKVLITTNGGESWDSASVGTKAPVKQVQIPDGQKIWALVGGSRLWFSGDAGTSWHMPDSIAATASQYPCNFFFLNGQQGWVTQYGNRKLYNTTNGGETWKRSPYPIPEYTVTCLRFQTPAIGWIATSEGKLYKTTDSGRTWVQKSGGLISLLITQLKFTSLQSGWLLGSGWPLLTKDGGETWSAAAYPFITPGNDLAVFSQSKILIPCIKASLHCSADSGATWSKKMGVHDSITYHWVGFNTRNQGFAYRQDNKLWQTTDSGYHWTPFPMATTKRLSSIYFLNEQNGWIAADSGKIFRTENGGQSWQSNFCGNTTTIRAVYFINRNEGWAVGVASKIFKTTDGGAHWEEYSTGLTYGFHSVFFHNSQNGWVVGPYGSMAVTTDGGATWNLHTSGNFPPLKHVRFANSEVGIAVGMEGLVRRTLDGGASWHKLSLGLSTSHNLNTVWFTSPEEGWISGEGGVLLKTVDGGLTWKNHSPTNNHIMGMSFLPSKEGWLVGQYGTIMHIDGLPVAVKPVQTSPFVFSIFPNPASQYVHLNVSGEILAVQITDVLGQTVAFPEVMENKICVSTLTPGLYYVVVQTPAGRTIGKMVKE